MRSAVSKSTWVPSTAAARMLRGAGIGAPLSVLRRFAGNAGSIAASAGVDGVPPGIRYFGLVPGLRPCLARSAGRDPRAGLVEHLLRRRRQLVDDPDLEGLRGLVPLALRAAR